MSNLKHRRFLAALCLAPLIATACGGDDSSSSAQTTAPAEDGGGEVSSLDELIEAAEAEGKVTVYSDQAEGPLRAMADAFMDEYPAVEVEIVRDIHPNISPAAELELQSGNGIADVYVSADAAWFGQQGEAGSFLPVQGPELQGDGDYDAASFVKEGNHFEVGGAVNVYAWNTSEWPDGLTGDFAELLDADLKGRIGMIEPASAVYVDWYMWLEERMGEGFLEDLAAQNPRVYQGAAPLNEALGSGEIAVTPYAFPVMVKGSQAAGAPVEFEIPEGGFWGAPHHGGVLKSAPNPNAGFLYANFMLTADAQKILNADQSSIIDGAGLAFNKDMNQPLSLTPDEVTAFQARWRELFTGG